MTEDRPKPRPSLLPQEEPEMLELQADSRSVVWGWITLIILILCITAYKMLKLYYAAH